MSVILDEQYVTVAEAARLLQVHPSSIRRWMEAGTLPAFRVGQRRILLKRADLARLITPARVEQGRGARPSGAESMPVSPMSPQERARLLAVVEAARQAQQAQLARRGGKLFPSSDTLIDEARDQRTRDLS